MQDLQQEREDAKLSTANRQLTHKGIHKTYLYELDQKIGHSEVIPGVYDLNHYILLRLRKKNIPLYLEGYARDRLSYRVMSITEMSGHYYEIMSHHINEIARSLGLEAKIQPEEERPENMKGAISVHILGQ